MFSKLVGRSGHEYVYIKELKDEFNNLRFRHHVDTNLEEDTLVYDFFKTDLFQLVEGYLPIPVEARKAILKEVGLALNDMHAKNWIHLDVKPNNVFVKWHVDEKDQFHVERVALGDMDCSLKLRDEILLSAKIGNVMWRSPKGQPGKDIGKPSEVFSFGLLCLYVLTSIQSFHPNFEELKEEGVEPEGVLLYELLAAFGPLPNALLLTGLWNHIAQNEKNEYFEDWSEEVFTNLNREAKRFIRRMTNLDPMKRASMSEIMADPFWQ
ncbi:kinase-like protein [Ophiobolus disseminans]|uniref:Kinase-like protein n=1 Tax=Ophiobolus disseminans TaxID=1469910 RepID=A0A6A6ZJ77_9PLEO|nr:kinase-like protein [Ophiobolus disseminans]